MNDFLVSIVIPVYKTEKYLDQCVRSALEQSYPALEILLVDDGSPDRCPEMIDAYAAQHENVTAIHQKNQGQGIARNTGIQAAHGEYVFLMDSDDCLDGPNAIELLVTEAKRTGADLIVGNYRKFCDDKIWDVNHHHLRAGEYTKTADFRFEGFYRYGHLAYNWAKLYRRAFLVEHDIWSKDYPFTQDKANNILFYAYQPKYAFIDDSVYLYRINDESITFRYKPNMKPVWISIATDFHEELGERGIEDEFQDLTAFHVFFGSFFAAKQELMAKHGLLKARAAVKEYGQDPFVRQAMKELAGGKYVKDISCRTWKIVIRMAALLFHLHGYFLFALGIALVRALRIDGRITEKRNRADKYRHHKLAKGHAKGYTREVDSLCELLKMALSGKTDKERVKALLDGVNLEEVLSMAGQHKILPMLYDVLEEYLEEKNPEQLEMVSRTTEDTIRQSYRLLFLTKELTERFRGEGIPTVVLKGSGVASWYPVPEYRKSGDVDLLFPGAAQVRSAGKVLEKLQYELKEEQHANHHLVYQGADGIDVELHSMLAEPFDDEWINQKMKELTPAYFEPILETDSMGVSIPTAALHLQALELLLHMLQHFLRAGFGLKLLADWVVFWNGVTDQEVLRQYVELAEQCKVEGFSKAITLLCEKFLGLEKTRIYGPSLEKEFSNGYAEHFLMDVIGAEEFGKADKNRMVALRKKGFVSYLKEFHYQMRMNYATESQKKWKWPYLWCKTLVTFLKNNRKLGRGSVRNILKSAGQRAKVVEEMQLFRKKK